ncbi:hypothetical protein D7147_04845 [Micromonospora musae]|uniref:Uncharacterized protein n=1 Tax=Micromonospora musae TaxID=1894970 RepID=A0ABX9RGY2_9ACTN|nr:hypothetical protein D7147_04845 [Micromonospora musae]
MIFSGCQGAPGRLRALVTQAREQDSYIVCHDTLPHYLYPRAKPAICRSFADRPSVPGGTTGSVFRRSRQRGRLRWVDLDESPEPLDELQGSRAVVKIQPALTRAARQPAQG